jgi:hypothetical protein
MKRGIGTSIRRNVALSWRRWSARAGTATLLCALGCSSTASSGSNSGACDPDGTWAVQFQWSGRTPGALTLVIAGTSIQQESGPGVGAASGTVSVSGHQLTWRLSDGSTWTGAADSSCATIANGTMTSSTGNPGSFAADKQGGTGSSSSSGGSSGGATTCGTVSVDGFYSAASTSVPASCTSCVTGSCCTTGDACDGDPTCVALMSCIGGCSANDTTCLNNCASQHGGGTSSQAFTEMKNLLNCVGNGCSACP